MNVKRSSSPTAASACGEGVRLLRCELATAFAQSGEVGEGQDVCDLRAGDLGALLLVLDEHGRPRLSARARSARPWASCSRRPPRRRLRSALARSRRAPTRGVVWARIPNASPLRTPEREQPVRELVDRSRGLVPGDLAPAVGAFDQIGGVACDRPRPRRATDARLSALRRPVRWAPAAPLPSSRSGPQLTLTEGGEGSMRPRRNSPVPLEFRRRTHANYLERIPQFWPGHHPGRARACDGAEGPRLGCLVPHAAPGVQDPDQAEAVVPGARARGHGGRARQGLGGLEGPVRDRRGRRPRGDRAAGHLARDRDLAVRPARAGRPGLLRPHLLPRARPPPRRSGGRTCCSSTR